MKSLLETIAEMGKNLKDANKKQKILEFYSSLEKSIERAGGNPEAFNTSMPIDRDWETFHSNTFL